MTSGKTSAETIRVHLIDGYRCTAWGVSHLIGSAKGFKLTAVSHDREEAVTHLSKHPADVIVMEPDLLEGNGFDLIPEIINQHAARVLLLTCLKDTTLLDRSVLLGAAGVYNKTDSPEQLLKAIECIYRGEIWLNRNATTRLLVEAARMHSPRVLTPQEAKIATLSKKERQVLEAVINAPEMKLESIASKLNISQHTLRNHLANIYQKLNVKNRVSLFTFTNHLTGAA
jgi:two-component system nitrate/nitrite response regulator NarL